MRHHVVMKSTNCNAYFPNIYGKNIKCDIELNEIRYQTA